MESHRDAEMDVLRTKCRNLEHWGRGLAKDKFDLEHRVRNLTRSLGFDSLQDAEQSQSLNIVDPHRAAPAASTSDADGTSPPDVNVNDLVPYVERVAALDDEVERLRTEADESIERAVRAEREIELLNTDCKRLTAANRTLTASLHEEGERVAELEREKRGRRMEVEEEKDVLRRDFEERLAIRDATIANMQKKFDSVKRETDSPAASRFEAKDGRRKTVSELFSPAASTSTTNPTARLEEVSLLRARLSTLKAQYNTLKANHDMLAKENLDLYTKYNASIQKWKGIKELLLDDKKSKAKAPSSSRKSHHRDRSHARGGPDGHDADMPPVAGPSTPVLKPSDPIAQERTTSKTPFTHKPDVAADVGPQGRARLDIISAFVDEHAPIERRALELGVSRRAGAVEAPVPVPAVPQVAVDEVDGVPGDQEAQAGDADENLLPVPLTTADIAAAVAAQINGTGAANSLGSELELLKAAKSPLSSEKTPKQEPMPTPGPSRPPSGPKAHNITGTVAKPQSKLRLSNTTATILVADSSPPAKVQVKDQQLSSSPVIFVAPLPPPDFNPPPTPPASRTATTTPPIPDTGRNPFAASLVSQTVKGSPRVVKTEDDRDIFATPRPKVKAKKPSPMARSPTGPAVKKEPAATQVEVIDLTIDSQGSETQPWTPESSLRQAPAMGIEGAAAAASDAATSSPYKPPLSPSRSAFPQTSLSSFTAGSRVAGTGQENSEKSVPAAAPFVSYAPGGVYEKPLAGQPIGVHSPNHYKRAAARKNSSSNAPSSTPAPSGNIRDLLSQHRPLRTEPSKDAQKSTPIPVRAPRGLEEVTKRQLALPPSTAQSRPNGLTMATPKTRSELPNALKRPRAPDPLTEPRPSQRRRIDMAAEDGDNEPTPSATRVKQSVVPVDVKGKGKARDQDIVLQIDDDDDDAAAATEAEGGSDDDGIYGGATALKKHPSHRRVRDDDRRIQKYSSSPPILQSSQGTSSPGGSPVKDKGKDKAATTSTTTSKGGVRPEPMIMTRAERELHFMALKKQPTSEYKKAYAVFKGRGRYAQPVEGSSDDQRYEINSEQNDGMQQPFEEVVRNKSARKRMHAVDCACCKDYYDAVGPYPPRLEAPPWKTPSPSPPSSSPQKAGESSKRRFRSADPASPSKHQRAREKEIQEHRQQVSRHRHRWAPTNTPPDYWTIGFPDTQQLASINSRAKEMHAAKRKHIAEEANKSDGRYRKKR